eukprot:Phypoly_transcript_02839.p2 GENE.Phypoly_transcript_02839~~Phypoly_transcript_02839.p2  ORF type:complete len:294 (+),score=99.73 Phypoly_transcript_02839:1695-2576(+)
MRTVCGTPQYVAPEILTKAEKEGYGKAVDMWSLGVILFVLLGGYAPFEDDPKGKVGAEPLFEKIKKAKYTFDARYWKAISEDAKDLIQNLLVVDASKRLTAEQALAHPWMAKYHNNASKPFASADELSQKEKTEPKEESEPVEDSNPHEKAEPKVKEEPNSKKGKIPKKGNTTEPKKSKTGSAKVKEEKEEEDDEKDEEKGKEKEKAKVKAKVKSKVQEKEGEGDEGEKNVESAPAPISARRKRPIASRATEGEKKAKRRKNEEKEEKEEKTPARKQPTRKVAKVTPKKSKIN